MEQYFIYEGTREGGKNRVTGANMTNMRIECNHSATHLMEICYLDKNILCDSDKYKVFVHELG